MASQIKEMLYNKLARNTVEYKPFDPQNNRKSLIPVKNTAEYRTFYPQNNRKSPMPAKAPSRTIITYPILEIIL